MLTNSLTPGRRVAVQVVEALTRTQIVQYAGASGDFNPIHTDEVFATEIAGLPSVMAHGMLTMGLVARALTQVVSQEHISAFGGRFKSSVWPGDTITVGLTLSTVDIGTVDIVATNQSGTELFTGYARVMLPA
ncbi:acyl dehydratase [Mycolicibacterium goodii]|uniref:MaoC-like domain-containing protein n=1 Tax=Mycolicibacterium goodii TaxID=134601 RepID=A0A0K0X3R4_MYCGD|nr:MaoC/PaaZ C-terminal domain-containing protein [Mycolicibacterium goodii]AKS32100.1 hypothetical protein AFA91_09705 [Mycolicibacterium goodii]MBU8808189.1 acyl dehydratase [Mycolicibacterium goodii]